VRRSEDDRFADILVAVQRCQDCAPPRRSDDLGSMADDALLRNMAVVGEVVRSLSARLERSCLRFRGRRWRAYATSSCTNTHA
jgi:uncharacterized protein with HEPN domain